MPDPIARRACITVLALLAAAGVSAAAAAAPAQIPTESFFRPVQNEMVKLSPTGRYLAVTVPAAKQTRLGVIDLRSMKITAVFSVNDQHHVSDFFWVGPERVVFDTYKKIGSLDFPVPHDEWFAGNADQSHFFSIGPLGQVLGRDRAHPNRVMVVTGDVYSVDTTGTGAARWQQVSALQLGLAARIGGIVLDSAYRARVAVVGEPRLRDVRIRARGRDDAPWYDAKKVADPNTQIFVPLAMAPDDDRVYVASNEGGATTGLFLWDPKTGKTEPVFRHPEVDIDLDGLVPSADRRVPVGIDYTDDRRRDHYFEPEHPDARLYREIAALFPDEQVTFTSFSDDGQQAIVMTWSDVNPGVFNLLDVKAGTVKPLTKRKPWIDPRQMAPMKPVAFHARDGTRLQGYLTLPRGAGASLAPMIVLVHGGPHERDRWGFDPEVQFLASRGFAVLQVNFRGSRGYGVAFERASESRWGLEPQNDVTDATRWAVAQGIADPDRICIYGSSYGGYSALMGVIREPELYRCAAGNAGVYDLGALKYEGDVANDTYWGTEFWQRELGRDKQTARRNSPVNRAAEIRVPVFLAHGGKDPRAPIGQFKAMKNALEDAGRPPETLVFDKEGHGFSEPAHLVEYYDRLAAFFARNTAPKPSAAPAPAAN